MIINDDFQNMINSPVRSFRGRVEIYEGSTLTLICGCHDSLKEFTVERVGEGKFFGYGVCQKINVKLRDLERNITVSTNNSIEVVFGKDTDYIYPFPRFYVTEVHRDENTNELSITAYDALYGAARYKVDDLPIALPYNIGEFATACASILGLPLNLNDIEEFNIEYPVGANFNGLETVRDALNAVAEATQTIYFIDWDWRLTFKRLSNDSAVNLTIDKEKYISLDNGENRRLGTICHVTELGDNVSISTPASGTTQYLRDNPFYTLRDDIGTLLEGAINSVGGLTINQFVCNWRGNFLLEIGDKVELITKNNNTFISYLLNDSLRFNGALSQTTEWAYNESDLETETNNANLGDTLKYATARVDKVNQQIDLVVGQVEANSENISSLQLTTENINLSVSSVSELVEAELEDISEELTTINNKVNAAITSEDVTIQINSALESGVNRVETTTGYKFDDTGLTISKTGSEMETAITDNGMTVYRDSDAVLIADHEGVKAEDLQATTFLIIGDKIRFESYNTNRIGCFWIGGNS